MLSKRRSVVVSMAAGAALVGACGSASMAWAQNQGAGAGEAARIQTLLVLERAEFGKMLVDPRDAGLVRALGMVPARLGELPGEVGAEREAIAAAHAAMNLLGRPGRLAISVNAGDPADGLFGYGVVLSANASDQKDAEAMHATVKGLLTKAQLPPPPAGPKRFESMEDSLLPGGTGRLSFGPRHGADGWHYEFILGTMENPDQAWANIPKPAIGGATPVLRGRVDLEGLTPLVNMFASFAGQNPEAAQAIRDVGKSGFYGRGAMKVDFEFGYSATQSRGRFAVENAGKFKEQLHISSEVLGERDYLAVPGDAVWAAVSKGDLGMIESVLDRAMPTQPQIGEGLDQFKQATGVDLREDVLKTLGGTIAYYASDATGGGTIGSVVAMMTFKDRARFMGAHEKLVKLANQQAATNNADSPGRYLRVQSWTHDGVPLFSVRMAGLPIPELCYAATDSWLIVGLTPQGVIAAAKQASGKGDKGLASNPAFAAVAKGRALIAANFMDGKRLAHAGYPIVALLGGAVGNGVRQPAFSSAPARDPGLVVPMFHDLTAEMVPSVTITSWSGDTLVTEAFSDRSMLSSGCAVAGLGAQLSPIIALAAIGAASNTRHGGMTLIEPDWTRMPIERTAGWMMTQPTIAPALIIASRSWVETTPE